MKRGLKNAIFAVGSFLFGGGLGYFLGFKNAKKKYKDTATTVFTYEIPEISKSEEEPKQPDTYNKELYKIVSDLNYAPPDPPIENPLVYPITLEDFALNRIFDQVVVHWYDEDGVLTDIEGNEIDPDETVGRINLNPDLFEEGELHIRNERLGVDYVVIQENHHITDSTDFPGFDDEEIGG